MKRYIIYKNERGVFFIDIAVAEITSTSCQGACGDTFYVKNNILYRECSDIDYENSINYDDMSFSSDVYEMGTVIYRTNSYDKVKNLSQLNIEKDDPWNKF